MLKINIEELKKTEFENVDAVCWEISNRIKDSGYTSLINVLSVCYAAYLSNKNKITEKEMLIEYLKNNLIEQQFLFIKENVGTLWSLVIEVAREYKSDTLLAVVLFMKTSTGRFGAENETPESIVKLAQKILKPSKESVADFCSGIGSFLSNSILEDSSSEYWGMEINTYSKEISSIRLSLMSDQVNIEQGNILSLDKEKKFDKIFSNFPWNLRTIDSVENKEKMLVLEDSVPELKKCTVSDWAFIANVIHHLQVDGKAVVVTTNGTTWNGGISKTIRERFLKYGFIEAVIALPENLYETTNIPTSLLVLSKNNISKSVRMIDATKMKTVGRRQNFIADDAIEKIVELLDFDSENSKIVSFDQMEAMDFAINPSRFLETEVEVENGVAFESVIKNITRGSQIKANALDKLVSDIPTKYQYLMLSNIQDGIIDDELPYLKELDAKLEKYCLKNNSLIISKNGAPVKLAVANITDDIKVLANGNLYILELDETKVNPYFVKAYFESENGIIALSRITVGAALPNIPVDGLKKIMIPLPPLDEQNIVVEEYKDKIDEIKVLRYRLMKAKEQIKNIYKEG